MTTFDFTPLFRSTVGFDRLMNLMETSARWAEAENGYPPYNIEKTGQDRYRITVAVAGFDEKELSAEVRENVLFIEGRKREPETGHTYLYHGIAGRSFKRQFQLADYVQVVSASVRNGLLIVELVRELPEAMKPRKIEIVGSSSRDDRKPEDSQLIEGSPEAA
jgi:molecular chaperone IbpA